MTAVDPNCLTCKGKGFIYGKSLLEGGHSCHCLENSGRASNLEKAWKSLSEAVIPKSGFEGLSPDFTTKNCWITAERQAFRSHLKSVILQKPSTFFCRVHTDAELLDSWFGTAKANGVKIFDLDVEGSTLSAIDIRDLIEPPDLAIIWLGVKSLPNKASPATLLEAFNYRSHVGKPTWIVDQPSKRFEGGHLFYSLEMVETMKKWPHLTLTNKGVKSERPSTPVEEEAPRKPIKAVEDFDPNDILGLTSGEDDSPGNRFLKRVGTKKERARRL